jgi:hypothetical protein|tara:strand:- start:1373 stop:1921 length:549 start_codon:yes stop_codon:yes gene_type:complete
MNKFYLIILSLFVLISCKKQVCENIGPLDNPVGTVVDYDGSYVVFRFSRDSIANNPCAAWFTDTILHSTQSFRRVWGAVDEMQGFLNWGGLNSTRTIERKQYYASSPDAIDYKEWYGLCEQDFIISEHPFTYTHTTWDRWVGYRYPEKIMVYLSPDQKQLNMIRIFQYNKSGIAYIFKGHAK